MKKNHYRFLFFAAIISLTSCSKNFDKINTSPDAVTEPSLDYVLPDIELLLLDQAYYTSVTVIAQLMQQISSYGANYNTITIGSNPEYHFTYQYSTPIKYLADFISHTEKENTNTNYNAIGRILRVYALHTVTDLYGDVPYFSAGKGYLDRNFLPAYDDQKLIYADMLKELEEAAASFDKSQVIPTTADIVYGGNIIKWKKFSYSLMLRLALRINKADPENSAKWISTAIKGGLLTNNEDNFTVNYKPNTYYATISNGQPTPFIYYTTWKLAAPFVDYLKANNDPRIYVYSVLPNKDSSAAKQKGLPAFTPSNDVPLPLTEYSVSPATTFGKYDAPFIHLSYSQVQLMLSEIAIRGLVPELNKSDAAMYYENGIRAAMNELTIYGGSHKITDGAINNYVNANKLSTSNIETALKEINTQYWVETHYNFYEMYANWRRSGYPVMTQSGQQLPRRLMYPTQETNISSSNIQEAVKRQGPDLPTTKIWWDK